MQGFNCLGSTFILLLLYLMPEVLGATNQVINKRIFYVRYSLLVKVSLTTYLYKRVFRSDYKYMHLPTLCCHNYKISFHGTFRCRLKKMGCWSTFVAIFKFCFKIGRPCAWAVLASLPTMIYGRCQPANITSHYW